MEKIDELTQCNFKKNQYSYYKYFFLLICYIKYHKYRFFINIRFFILCNSNRLQLLIKEFFGLTRLVYIFEKILKFLNSLKKS